MPRAARAVAGRVRQVRGDSDRGDVIGWAITAPAIMLLTIGSVQVVLWYEARAVCHAAADTGSRAGAATSATAGIGRAAAMTYLTETGGDTVTNPQTTELMTATAVTVTCTANAERVIPLPGFSVDVAQSSTAARERFTTPDAP